MMLLSKITCIIAFCVTSSYQQSCSTQSGKDISNNDLTSRSGHYNRFRGLRGFRIFGRQDTMIEIHENHEIRSMKSVVAEQYVIMSRIQNCCSICSQTPGCKAFAWSNYQGGTCWLKSATTPIISKPGVSVGILGGSNNGGNEGGPTAETGICSWYGADGEIPPGSRTASGAVFNRDVMSAAHKTLQFDTVIRVKNEKNGQTVDVTIDDRGPFVEGRIVDLSFAAFGRVANRDDGTIPCSYVIVKRP